jgi:hypothetical protein
MQYITTRVEYSNSDFFQTLCPQDAVNLLSKSAGLPVLTVLKSWLYAVGYKPGVASDITQMAASGSKIVMQLINDGQGNPQLVRMILLESDFACTIKRLDTSATVTIFEGQYVDAVRKSDGSFDHFTQVAAFDEANPPAGSTGLIAEINSAKTGRNIP